MSKHVAVLMGGWSAERAVSLVSGASVAEALRARGHRVTEIDVDRDVVQQLQTVQPDVVFNALHGRIGEDGAIQGLLEVMGLALHPFRRSCLRAGDGQAHCQNDLRTRRHSLHGGPGHEPRRFP